MDVNTQIIASKNVIINFQLKYHKKKLLKKRFHENV